MRIGFQTLKILIEARDPQALTLEDKYDIDGGPSVLSDMLNGRAQVYAFPESMHAARQGVQVAHTGHNADGSRDER